METWFSSDSHFGHRNIIKFCNRPFNNVKEMDETLIKNWNDTVKPDDVIWILGDFTMESNPTKYLLRLNGKKFLVKGNHDKQPSKSHGWSDIYDFKEIKVNNTWLTLCHYALQVWNNSHRGSISLYGHSHNTLPGNNQQLDVGVDSWDFKPVNLEQIQERLKTLPNYKHKL